MVIQSSLCEVLGDAWYDSWQSHHLQHWKMQIRSETRAQQDCIQAGQQRWIECGRHPWCQSP